MLNKGETKKRRKKKNVNEQTVGKGGGRPGGTTEKEKKGDRKVGILRRMLRVLSGVARGSHSALPPTHSSKSSLLKSPWTGVTGHLKKGKVDFCVLRVFFV